MVSPFKTVEYEQEVYTQILDLTDNEGYEEILEDYEDASEIMWNLKTIVYDIRQKAIGMNDKAVRVQTEKILKELTDLNVNMKF